jgi:3-methyladenine DNA glycosylase/8-oxoguanine DNA glycosylase
MFHLGHPNILPVGDLGVRKVGADCAMPAGYRTAQLGMSLRNCSAARSLCLACWLAGWLVCFLKAGCDV